MIRSQQVTKNMISVLTEYLGQIVNRNKCLTMLQSQLLRVTKFKIINFVKV